jgi:hypothetical protein
VQLAAVLSVGALTTLFAVPASAEVTQVSGGAYGFRASVSLFGGPANTAGPSPTVTLPSNGASPAITASEPEGKAQFGPATIFSSRALTVSTEGTLGPNGSVTSSADIREENASGQEVFTAARVQSSCRAAESGASGSTTITGGELITSEGNPDVEGDETKVTIPSNPAPNTEHRGTIEAVGDSFRIVFNEQISQAGGVTVNAVHMYLIGPTAVGDLFVGQSVCAVNAGGGGGGGGGSSPTTTVASGGGRGTGTSGGGSTPGGGSPGSGGGGSNMPKTGLDVLPLTVVGTELVAGGVAALVWAGRRRRWPRR